MLIIHKLFSLARDWSQRVTWANIPQLKLGNMYGLLTKCEVKMAGYWLSSFFGVFIDRDAVEVNKLAIKERGQYPAILTEQTWSIKDLLYGFWGAFFLRDTAGSP